MVRLGAAQARLSFGYLGTLTVDESETFHVSLPMGKSGPQGQSGL